MFLDPAANRVPSARGPADTCLKVKYSLDSCWSPCWLYHAAEVIVEENFDKSGTICHF